MAEITTQEKIDNQIDSLISKVKELENELRNFKHENTEYFLTPYAEEQYKDIVYSLRFCVSNFENLKEANS